MDRSFFCFVTMHAFDTRTDRQTDRWRDNFLLTRGPCIQCSAVKNRKDITRGERSTIYRFHCDDVTLRQLHCTGRWVNKPEGERRVILVFFNCRRVANTNQSLHNQVKQYRFVQRRLIHWKSHNEINVITSEAKKLAYTPLFAICTQPSAIQVSRWVPFHAASLF